MGSETLTACSALYIGFTECNPIASKANSVAVCCPVYMYDLCNHSDLLIALLLVSRSLLILVILLVLCVQNPSVTK